MSPDGLLPFLPMLVYPARSCHCLPEGSLGHIMFFPCPAQLMPPITNRIKYASLCDIHNFFCCRPRWPFYPDLGSVCFLLFSQAGFLGFPVNTPCIFFFFFHFHTFAWAASPMRMLNFISLSYRICQSFVCPHRSSQFSSSPVELFLTTTCLPSKTMLFPPVFIPLVLYSFRGPCTP